MAAIFIKSSYENYLKYIKNFNIIYTFDLAVPLLYSRCSGYIRCPNLLGIFLLPLSFLLEKSSAY